MLTPSIIYHILLHTPDAIPTTSIELLWPGLCQRRWAAAAANCAAGIDQHRFSTQASCAGGPKAGHRRPLSNILTLCRSDS